MLGQEDVFEDCITHQFQEVYSEGKRYGRTTFPHLPRVEALTEYTETAEYINFVYPTFRERVEHCERMAGIKLSDDEMSYYVEELMEEWEKGFLLIEKS